MGSRRQTIFVHFDGVRTTEVFTEQLAKWEFDISEYGRVTQGKLPGLLKGTLLITQTSGAM